MFNLTKRKISFLNVSSSFFFQQSVKKGCKWQCPRWWRVCPRKGSLPIRKVLFLRSVVMTKKAKTSKCPLSNTNCHHVNKIYSDIYLQHLQKIILQFEPPTHSWNFLALFFRENHGKILKSAKQRMISNILWRWRQVCPSFLDGYFITILLLLLLNTILYKKKNARPRDPCAYPPMGQPNDH